MNSFLEVELPTSGQLEYAVLSRTVFVDVGNTKVIASVEDKTEIEFIRYTNRDRKVYSVESIFYVFSLLAVKLIFVIFSRYQETRLQTSLNCQTLYDVEVCKKRYVDVA